MPRSFLVLERWNEPELCCQCARARDCRIRSLRGCVDRRLGNPGWRQKDGEVCRREALLIEMSGRTASFVDKVSETGLRTHDKLWAQDVLRST